MRHKEMLNKLETGEIKSLHRDREEIVKSKLAKGGLQASSWFLGGDTVRSVRCHPTPGGTLRKMINKELNSEEPSRRTHVVEEGGLPVTSAVRKSDPFHNGSCRFGDKDCLARKGTDCGKSGCLYEITCDTCKDPVIQTEGQGGVKDNRAPGSQGRHNYIGMTYTSLHCRMLAHRKGQRRRTRSNPLHRHDGDHHQGEPQSYTARILTREQKLLPLNVIESLYIEAQAPNTTMNKKNEHGRGKLVRMQATRDLT